MHIVIAGGSGFLGSALTRELARRGHAVTNLTRRHGAAPPSGASREVVWHPDGRSGAWASAIEGASAVVNLAGESIAGKRWTSAQKQRIRESRLNATHSLTAAVRNAAQKPRVLVSGSAVGYYGARGEEPISESSGPGDDFLAGVAREWEAAALAIASELRVVVIRTGIVLDPRGGALKPMLLPFRMFVGGPLASGTQYMPWIHIDDWVSLVIWAIENEHVHGPVNATSPNPVTNAEFSKALGRALHRPALLPAPAFALKLALGEMADALLIGGQRVLPVRAVDAGFVFAHPQIDEALASILP